MISDLQIIEQPGEFFAPVPSDLIDSLVGQYQSTRAKINEIADLVMGSASHETSVAMSYFLAGNRDYHARYSPSVAHLFRVEGAIAALNAGYWSKAMNMTDVLDTMPQKRRDEWSKSITEHTTPEFEESTVRATMESLLASRAKFLGERVDGIFQGLSGEHVTNSPMGFGKRMIIGYVLNEYHSVGHSKSGLINDLRAVIAKFMGRDEPKYYVSSRLIESLKSQWGEWVTVDGGALRIRLYKKGTAHLEVHPDMAWRLNSILASMHPMAIPSEFRTKPKRRAKVFTMIARPLPFAVLEVLADSMPRRGEMTVSLSYGMRESARHAWEEAGRILEGIGGVKQKLGDYAFEYSPREVITEIITSGCIPDQQSHQYYPTPELIAKAAIEMADIGEDDLCLEPSAGQGGLADYLPRGRTTCVEISALHCSILESKGHMVTKADFIEWADKSTARFDRIVMNPPFSDGRAKAHVEAAAKLLTAGGRIVAVLPASMREKYGPDGMSVTWSREYAGEFAGTGVSVAIMAGVAP